MHDIAVLSHNDLDRIAIAHDANSGLRMMKALYAFIGRFVAYPSDSARVAHALWIIHSHMMEKWEATPRLAFLSAEPASGKTRAMEITELLVPNPVAAVNVSPAYLFRKVGSAEPVTVLFDEIDTVFGPKAKENEEIRGLLNAGHRRGAVAGRCVVRGKEIVTEEIPAYAAVALAGLGWLPDTIMSRAVIIRMRRRHQGEKVEQFRSRIHSPEGHAIRTLIEVWVQTVPQVEWANVHLPPEIQDRNADVWEPLIAVADAIGGDWSERARKAAVGLLSTAADAEPSLGVRLLMDLRAVFADAKEMPSKSILLALNAIEEAPWSNLKGKPLDERGLATRLKQYGIKSKVIWFGAKQARGYHRSDLSDAWVRYLPQQPASFVTNVTSITRTANITDVTQVTPPAGHNGGFGAPLQCACCQKEGDLLECDYGDSKPWLHRECIKHWLAAHTDQTEAAQ